MAVPSRVPQILVGNIIPQLFASLFVLARITTKTRLTRAWGADDTMLVIAWVLSIALTILACLQTRYGIGKHIQDVSPAFLETGLKLEYGNRIPYFLSLGFTKVSICLFYLRVFRERYSRIIAMGTMGFTILFTVPTVIVTIFQCSPISGFWDKTIKFTCINTNPSFYAAAACNIAADTVLIILVVFSVLSLKLERRQKLVLLIVISSGWLAVIASIIRAVRISQILTATDFTWDSYDASIWSAVDVDIGIFCTAAPSIKPLLRKLFPSLMGTSAGKHSSSAFPHSNSHTARGTNNGGAFELSSQTGTKSNITANKYWDRSKTDNDSQEALQIDGIMKSTSVKIDSEAVSGTSHQSRESLSSTEYTPA